MKKSLFFLALLPCLFIVSCKPANKDLTPSPEFARYITAYTGGVITPHSAIQIQLAQPQPSVQVNTPIKEQLFSFKPALKGTAYWVNNRCIEFFPDEGALQQGQLYQAEFKLGKIQQAESKFNTFAFSFRVEKQSFMWESEPCIITAATPNSATVRGQIRFNNSVSAEKVARLFTVNIAKIAPKVEGTSDPKTFTITFEDIPLTDREQTFRIEIKGKAMGIDKTVQDEVVIPQSGLFYPLSVRALSQPELGVEVVFSQALQPNQNLRGLVSITGAGSSYVYQIEENRVRVFFERRPAGEIGVAVYRGVKSASGKVIEYDASYSVAFASIHPQVVLPFPGTILPDSKNLILPFRTVNLSAVDIRIIRIFEHNILSFMQSNTLNTTYELRRYGRLIQKKTLWLDRETDIKQDSWHNFSIDLSTLMKQEPGAIYHIDISFQQAYSLYPGANALDRNASGQKLGDSPTEPPSQGMVFFNGSNLSEKEEAFWDETQSYYYGYNDIDWSLYNWNEAGDPSKPSFYMSRRRSVFCNVIGSNLGIIAKGGAQNKLWITVSDITTVKPVKDAQITVYNYQLQQIGMAATDSDGFAVVEPNGKPFVMTAKHQGQTSYLRLADGEEKSLSRFDVGGREVQRGLKGYIYGERGVWRPGDTLFLSFILEDKLQRLPASHPVT
ncbi:MAG: alpha-2-macroglobulin, partial [Bacteroidales bacterium]|nr:alpha-2-macroglobulin [Bacteroidales bacterium]